MYRKHLNETTTMDSTTATPELTTAAARTGLKTIDKIADLPVVNTALNNVTGYYESIKDKNYLLGTACNLAEFSFKTMKFASQPITNLCAKQVESVDTFLSEKVDMIENSYPILNKPSEEVTSAAYTQAKGLYEKGTTMVTNPKDTLYTTATLATAAGGKVLNTCLDSKYAKMVTNPVLDYTEKTLNNYLSPYATEQDQPTVMRIYNINKRVYDHVYDASFIQLKSLHMHFEETIKKMEALRTLVAEMYATNRDKFLSTASEFTLVKMCQTYLDKNNITLESAKSYYKALLTDISDILGKYMGLIKTNFPAYLENFQFQSKIDWLKNQMSKENFSIYLSMSIENLKKINESLIEYTRKMLVFADSKFPQLAKQFNFGLEKSVEQTTTTTGTEPIKPVEPVRSVVEPILSATTTVEPIKSL